MLKYDSNWPYQPPNPPKTPPNGQTGDTKKAPTTTQAIIFGLGSMFNHSMLHQNVGWERDIEKLVITYKTLRDIRKGEELCISYGSRLTFVDTDAAAMMSDDEAEEVLGRIEIDD